MGEACDRCRGAACIVRSYNVPVDRFNKRGENTALIYRLRKSGILRIRRATADKYLPVILAFLIVPSLVIGVALPTSSAAATKPLKGLCFSPYLKVDPGTEISSLEIGALLSRIAPYTGGIRTFCSTGMWASMPQMAVSRGMSVAAGCDLWNNSSYNKTEVNWLIAQCRTGNVSLAVVGDETLCGTAVSESALIGYMNRVKATGVPTTTSQTYDELLAHPGVMAACDVVVMNIYPFWEGVSIGNSVSYINTQYQKVKKAAAGKKVIVETGWPSAGQKVGSAVPSPTNAASFLKNFVAWANANGVQYYYFEAFDELWKVENEGAVGSHWGVWDQNGMLKPGMGDILGVPWRGPPRKLTRK